jgi:hypothetical protein
MKTLFPALLLASFVAGIGLLVSSPADACSPVMARGAHVTIAGESAIIVWDEKAKRQHFIRRAAFDTAVPYFGFLVPTPTEPKLAEAPDELFTRLEDWTKPAVETRRVPRPRGPKDALRRMEPMAAPAGAVHVLAEQRVGRYDAVTLKATDAKALAEWLQKRGYVTRPELEKWLEPYIQAGWIITAFQIPKPDPKRSKVSTDAVLMSFDTDRPFFPYSEPADQRAGGAFRGNRLLRVFFVGTERMHGALDHKSTIWPGRACWAGPLEDGQQKSLHADLGKIKEIKVSVPEKAYLTVFDDSSSPRPGTADLFFSRSADQSILRRTPIIQFVYVDGPAGLEPQTNAPAGSSWYMGPVVLGISVLIVGVILLATRLVLKRMPPQEE